MEMQKVKLKVNINSKETPDPPVDPPLSLQLFLIILG